MRDEASFLVVGGDSLVGGGVAAALERRGHKYYVSTRRRATVGGGRVFLDFETLESVRAPDGVRYAYIIAAATNYDRCESDPMARVINVDLIPRAVGSLLNQGIFVTFISTNSVFGGERSWPEEDSYHEPRIAYAQQKSEGEQVVRDHAARLDASGRFNIVRLTKIMNSGVSPVPSWVKAWKQGEIVEPFSDLIFAPMSVRFVGEALVTVGEKRVSGNLHLSGAENVSYVDYAHALARRLGVDTALIRPTTATEKGISIAFKPRYSGLGMTRTTQLTNIRPQNLADHIEDLVRDIQV